MKNLKFNKLYSFDELPTKAQEDFLTQFENDFEFDKDDFIFCLQKIPYQELLAEFDEILGPNLIDELEDEYIIELAKDIETNGLLYPPIGSEGIHRSLAHLHLKKDLLRFTIFNNEAITD